MTLIIIYKAGSYRTGDIDDFIPSTNLDPLTGYEPYRDYPDEQEILSNKMISIIQNDRYSPSVRSANMKAGYLRKTPFSNKRIHCKRKRRMQYV